MGMAWNEHGVGFDCELALHLEGTLSFLGVQHSNGVWKTAWHWLRGRIFCAKYELWTD